MQFALLCYAILANFAILAWIHSCWNRGGATIGATLTYRFSLGQENRRKKREVIEELYELTYRLQDVLDVDVILLRAQFEQTSTNLLVRMKVLADLYFPSLTPSVKELSDLVSNLDNTIETSITTPRDEYREQFNRLKVAYSKINTKWLEKLKQLAKGSTDIT